MAPLPAILQAWQPLWTRSPHLIFFISLFLWRYTRFVVHVLSWLTFKTIPLPLEPIYTSSDVTVLIPTICGSDTYHLEQTIRQVLRNRPFQVIVITISKDLEIIAKAVRALDPSIKVLSVNAPNKRRHLARAIPHVTTPFILNVDDDSLLLRRFIEFALAPYSDSAVGAVDGGTSCLSGRAGLLRTHILSDPSFLHGYTNEEWRGKLLNPDDDNFVTRWMVSHGWKIVTQAAPEALVETYLETGHTYWKQCLRWTRSNWRSNFTSIFIERHVWSQQPWSVYALHLSTPTCSLVTDPALIYSLRTSGLLEVYPWALKALLAWMLVAKFTKLIPVFYPYPTDLIFFPITLIFGYLHGIQKYYALLTVNETGWGSRPIDGKEKDPLDTTHEEMNLADMDLEKQRPYDTLDLDCDSTPDTSMPPAPLSGYGQIPLQYQLPVRPGFERKISRHNVPTAAGWALSIGNTQ